MTIRSRSLLTLLAFAVLLAGTMLGQKGGGSRSYSSGSSSGSSRSYSSGSSSGSRSYSTPPSRSTPSSAPASRSYSSQPSARPSIPPSGVRTYGSTPSQSRSSAAARTYGVSPSQSRSIPQARTYAPIAPPVVYGGRSYIPVPYYHSPYFMSGGYYSTWGDGGMPWYGWAMLYNSHQQPIVVNASGGGGQPTYYDQGSTSFNWFGLLLWTAVIALVVWLIFRPRAHRAGRYYV